MTVLALALLVVAVAALAAARKNVSGAPVVVILATIGAVVVLVIGTIQSRRSSPARLKLEGETAAGEVIGRLVAADIKDGAILVIRNPPRAQMKSEITALRFAGLAAAMKGTTAQLIQAGPNMASLGSDDPSFTLFSDENFNKEAQAWFAAHTDVKAVISLRGILPPIPSTLPVYGFIDMRDAGWTDAIRSGHIKAAVMYRVRPPADELTPEANDGLPNKFKLVTKQNLDASLKELSP